MPLYAERYVQVDYNTRFCGELLSEIVCDEGNSEIVKTDGPE